MADTYYAGNLTRPNWAGTDADLDIHLEAYDGLIDGSFRVESMFRSSGLTNFRSVADRSNTWRGDRIGGVTIKGRQTGGKIEESRIPNEKFVITVDTLTYARTAVDYQDDWTAPDFQTEHSQEHGTAHAKLFDNSHIIQLIKAGSWKAPDSLKATGAFYDGISDTMTGYAAETDAAAKADMIVSAHKDALTQFVKRDLGGSLAEFVTLIRPEAFNILLDHDKLMNVQFQGNSGDNNFVQRRIAWMNGCRVVETPRFPDEAVTNHPLGSAFNVTAAEAKVQFIVFHPRKTLVTVEAKGLTTRFWDDQREFCNVLDSFALYTVGIRRGDACAVVNSD